MSPNKLILLNLKLFIFFFTHDFTHIREMLSGKFSCEIQRVRVKQLVKQISIIFLQEDE